MEYSGAIGVLSALASIVAVVGFLMYSADRTVNVMTEEEKRVAKWIQAFVLLCIGAIMVSRFVPMTRGLVYSPQFPHWIVILMVFGVVVCAPFAIRALYRAKTSIRERTIAISYHGVIVMLVILVAAGGVFWLIDLMIGGLEQSSPIRHMLPTYFVIICGLAQVGRLHRCIVREDELIHHTVTQREGST